MISSQLSNGQTHSNFAFCLDILQHTLAVNIFKVDENKKLF